MKNFKSEIKFLKIKLYRGYFRPVERYYFKPYNLAGLSLYQKSWYNGIKVQKVLKILCVCL
jgi:hypothetical protein